MVFITCSLKSTLIPLLPLFTGFPKTKTGGVAVDHCNGCWCFLELFFVGVCNTHLLLILSELISLIKASIEVDNSFNKL